MHPEVHSYKKRVLHLGFSLHLSHPKDNTDPLGKGKESECNLEKRPNKSVSVLGYKNYLDFSDKKQDFCQASRTAGRDAECGQ